MSLNFVDQENPDEEMALIMRTVEELPTSNRDTLAFLMSHLQRIAQNETNLMDSKALAKIFGPIIVGYSMINPPTNQLLAENPKQVKVMEALLRIPEDFWSGIISVADPNQQNKCLFNSCLLMNNKFKFELFLTKQMILQIDVNQSGPDSLEVSEEEH